VLARLARRRPDGLALARVDPCGRRVYLGMNPGLRRR
jgi:hypothetical protein